MKRSLFSPLNIIIVAVVAVAVWYYMKHMHKNEEAAQPIATEQVAVEVEEAAPVAEEAGAANEGAEETK
jgi:short subunit fatty acids transporter